MIRDFPELRNSFKARGVSHGVAWLFFLMGAAILAIVAGPHAVLAQTDGKKYPIKLSRTMPLGVEYEFRSKAQINRSASLTKVESGEEVSRTDGEVRAAMKGTAVQQEADGKALVTVSVEEFSMTLDGRDLPVDLFAGDELTGEEENGLNRFYINGNPVREPILLETLGGLIPLGMQDDQQDRTFGTDEPRAVGDLWKINEEQFLESLGEAGAQIDPESVNGVMKVQSLVENQGEPCLRIVGRVEVAVKDLPTELGDDSGEKTPAEITSVITLSADFPINDLNAPAPVEKTKVEREIKAQREDPEQGGLLDYRMEVVQQTAILKELPENARSSDNSEEG